MDLTKAMQTFIDVADTGSFIAAAEKQATSNASISRQIALLEEHLGVRLLQRTTRRLSLTETGQVMYERAHKILLEIGEMEAVIGQHNVSPKGQLRISAPLSFGTRVLSRVLPEFTARYPDIVLDISLNNRNVDLVDEGIDVALIMAQSLNPAMIARKLSTVDMLVCASPDYLARHGRPEHPSDLAIHHILKHKTISASDSWSFMNEHGHSEQVHFTPHLLANSGDILGDMARAGLGISAQPDFLAMEDIANGLLEPVLTDWYLGEYYIYATYVSRRYLSPKVRVFIDFLAEHLSTLCRERVRLVREQYRRRA